MALSAARDGWITLSGGDGTTVHVRAQRRGSRTTITDIYLHGDGITPAALRGVSISRLEAELNLACSPRPSVPASDLPTITAIYDAAQAEDDAAPEPTLAELRARTPAASPDEQPSQRSPLGRPGREGPDEFYQDLAAAYAGYAAKTKAPAKAIAAEAGVPVSAAHRWIREARRRGFLPSAQKGKAG